MAQLIWTDPALNDLDAIADYIAVDNPTAASRLVQRVIRAVERLSEFPESGSRPRELSALRYRQVVVPPCRVFYRFDGTRVFILYIIRGEQRLRVSRLRDRDRRTKE
jgi:plasmid stabilization system protein ParE